MLSLGNIPVFPFAIFGALNKDMVNISFSFKLKIRKCVKGF